MGERNLRLLTLDGGGVRGLSSLIILEQLMKCVNPSNPPKPCEAFDMIAGTSTGGLIAIMLGRLRMTASECIQAYLQISSQVFQKVGSRFNLKGKLQPQFASDTLEAAIKSIIKKQGLGENAPLKEENPVCKVIVCATRASTARITQFCNFETDRFMTPPCTIWEAARATSAATTFFSPIKIGAEQFVDGGTGANNPVRELWAAADLYWGGELESRLQLLLSIGTGLPKLHAFNDCPIEVAKSLLAIATETESTAEDFSRAHRNLTKERRYFRFNVDQGLDDIGLQEADKLNWIEGVTKQYLEKQSVYEARQGFQEACRLGSLMHKPSASKTTNVVKPDIEDLDPMFEEDRTQLYRTMRQMLPRGASREEDEHARAAEMVRSFLVQHHTSEGSWYFSLRWYMNGSLADLNIRCYDGKTPLHVAVNCKKDAKEKVEWLLYHGADPAMQDYGGRTPVDYARVKGDDAIFVILLSKWQQNILTGEDDKHKVPALTM